MKNKSIQNSIKRKRGKRKRERELEREGGKGEEGAERENRNGGKFFPLFKGKNLFMYYIQVSQSVFPLSSPLSSSKCSSGEDDSNFGSGRNRGNNGEGLPKKTPVSFQRSGVKASVRTVVASKR